MIISRLSLVVVFVSVAAFALADDPGLVARYTFDEGKGEVTADVSGHGNPGQIHGARFEKHGKGYCLAFDGVRDYVDCGPGIELRGAATVEAWVYPENRVTGEAGIVGKHFESVELTYYADGKCWWYISGGGNNAKGFLSTGAWHHVVGTFDGTTMTLYIDGVNVDSHASKAAEIKPGKNLFIGCVMADANATDPATGHTTYFPGKIDDVRIYSRALTNAEVRQHFEDGKQSLMTMAEYGVAEAAKSIRGGSASVGATAYGQVQIDTGKGVYLIESAFSFPGERIGWNVLAGTRGKSEERWTPVVSRPSDTSLLIAARGGRYALERKVTLARPDRIEIDDTLTDSRNEPTGIIVRNAVTSARPFTDSFTPGSAENPLIYVRGEGDALGILMEDDISRITFEPNLGLPPNQVRFTTPNLVLNTGKSVTLRWTVYLLPREAGYFELVNRIREDWKTNFTILGPFAFFDIGSPLLHDPVALKAYLERRRLGVAGLSPWLDYDPGSFDRVWPRDEFKARMQEAVKLLKAADPNIKCVGCIETDWVAIEPAKIPGGEKLPSYGKGSGELNTEQSRIIDAANLPWKDSIKRRADGGVTLELYSRGGKPQTSLSVYPRVGNHQYEFLMGQVKFLIDEMGLDGFYIDEFSQGWRGGIPSYEGWDGISAEVDPHTGAIGRKYTNCSLAGIEARVALCKYALERGKIVVANTYSTSMEEQALPVNRFSETQGSFDPMAMPDGQEPKGVVDIFRGNLATPIGLGIIGYPDKHDTAQRIMKAIVTYLRHGGLYYHYAIEDIPEKGEGSGEYGPINHMYPITPIGLHEGWIEGKERLIAARSGDYVWKGPAKPRIFRFDLSGREEPSSFAMQQVEGAWRVEVRIRDWAEIVVLE